MTTDIQQPFMSPDLSFDNYFIDDNNETSLWKRGNETNGPGLRLRKSHTELSLGSSKDGMHSW